MNEQALKDRLRNIAKKKHLTFQELWKKLLFERFLVRLENSKHQADFVLKGGALLAQYITLRRETIDIDFLSRNVFEDTQALQNVFTDISLTNTSDNLHFNLRNIELLHQPHMTRPGFRIHLDVQFEKMKDVLHIDLGFNDPVVPLRKKIMLLADGHQALFESNVTLYVYPLETIASEKLQSIVSRGSLNSRMKDFHDVFAIARSEQEIALSTFRLSIKETFRSRNTRLSLPLSWNQDETKTLQNAWKRYYKGLSTNAKKYVPENFDSLTHEINNWLSKIVSS